MHPQPLDYHRPPEPRAERMPLWLEVVEIALILLALLWAAARS